MASYQNKCGLKGGAPTVVVDKGDVVSRPMFVAGLVVQPEGHDGRMIRGIEVEWNL